jgi:predicted NBD/HSP70 family sugar kinase|tara:strand:+ start:172 stop:1086 length:915 start_codon:yes stop_codon:yes gene_type:complete
MNCLSFDVGGTTVKYGVIDESYKILKKDKIPTPENENDFIYSLSNIIQENLSIISKVSVAMPGYVNSANNKYLYGPHLKYDIDFSKLSNFTDYKFHLDNDGNVAAYCEYFLNYKTKYSNLIMLTFGTGVGGGIISEGRLLRGRGNAGEIGHMLTSNDREIEGDSGKKGSFESSVAASVWTKKCEELTQENQDSELAKIFATKNVGSVLFDNTLNLTNSEQAARDEIIQNISNGLLSLFEIFDNEAFILGGTMSSEPFDLIELLESDIKSRYKFPSRNFPEIFIASQGEDSGIIGAAALAFNEEN